MNNTFTKNFLPNIHKKGKSNCTSILNPLPEKKSQAESIFISKSRVFDKIPEVQKSPATNKFIIKIKVPRLKTNEDDKNLVNSSMNQLKSSFSNLMDASNPSSSRKEETYSRQSRLEAMIRPFRESKDSCSSTEHSQSISPEKKIKRPVGTQSLR